MITKTLKRVATERGIYRPAAAAGACVVLACFLFIIPCSQAGSYHSSSTSTLKCWDCHTMHFSEEGSAPARAQVGGPWKKMLIYDTTNGVNPLCLSCHDGQGQGASTAPDVYGAVGYAITRSAGQFGNTGVVNANGHNLDNTAATPETAPGGTWATPAGAGFSCIHCHEAHGTVNYRNLLLRPGGFASDLYVTSVTETLTTPTQTQYDVGNIKYTSSRGGLSRWCKACHTNFHCIDAAGGATCTTYWSSPQGTGGDADGDSNAVSTDQWKRHPTRDVTMAEACTNLNVDSADNLCTGAVNGKWWSNSSWLPVVSPSGTIPGTEAASDNEIFCGTCHKAHGSDETFGLVFDTPGTGVGQDDPGEACTVITCLCQNCHNK